MAKAARTFKMNGNIYNSMMDIARELGKKRIHPKDFQKYGIEEITGTVQSGDVKPDDNEKTVISVKEQKALDSLKKLSGWEEDGFGTGTNDNDVFYALNHELEDNGKLFLKTTYSAMVNGDTSEDEDNNDNWMTAQEVLSEVSNKSDDKESEKKADKKSPAKKSNDKTSEKKEKTDKTTVTLDELVKQSLVDFSKNLRKISNEDIIQFAKDNGVDTVEDASDERIRRMRVVMNLKAKFYPGQSLEPKKVSFKGVELQKLLDFADEQGIEYRHASEEKIQKMWVIYALNQAGFYDLPDEPVDDLDDEKGTDDED